VSTSVRSTVLAGFGFVLLAGGVSRLQPQLADEIHAIKDTDDVYPFPPPAVLRLATLGYVSVTIDVLWGKLLVEYGTHWGEHRPFADIEHYLDAIVALDPTFRPVYEYADSLLCYRPMNGHEIEARETRVYLERGTKELPNDAEIWRKYGQFLAFMGPSYLSSEDEKKQWRHDGAVALNHAVELGADMQLGLAASSLLDKRLGERRAAIEFLNKAYVMANDDATRAEIGAKLAALDASEAADRDRARFQATDARWRRDYPFTSYPIVSRGLYLLLGPVPDRDRCVGIASSQDSACARDWGPALSETGAK
jgi:tetratricopeptide (TPR) repeat protein